MKATNRSYKLNSKKKGQLDIVKLYFQNININYLSRLKSYIKVPISLQVIIFK